MTKSQQKFVAVTKAIARQLLAELRGQGCLEADLHAAANDVLGTWMADIEDDVARQVARMLGIPE